MKKDPFELLISATNGFYFTNILIMCKIGRSGSR